MLLDLRRRDRNLQNVITSEKRKSKQAHFSEKIIENKDNSSKIWIEIRSLVNLKPGKTSSIKILDENEKVISDSQKISNIFNEHYATLGAKVQHINPTQEVDFRFYPDKREKGENALIILKVTRFTCLQLATLRFKK